MNMETTTIMYSFFTTPNVWVLVAYYVLITFTLPRVVIKYHSNLKPTKTNTYYLPYYIMLFHIFVAFIFFLFYRYDGV